ncbi:MAG: DUF1593 domain-containing protein [Cyclobacteriaceae bacterium]
MVQIANAQSGKQRLLILADMGNEPDEVQQMVHMVMYSNEFDVEGLIAVSGKYLHSAHRLKERTRLYPDLFEMIIDAYQKDLKNLKKHATGWPEPDYLRSIVKSGQPDYGVDGMGAGKSTEGSELIIRCVEKDDPRPLYVVVNAGSNTLAQAIIDYQANHTKKELDTFLAKLRVFENGAQDNAGAWICANYPEIHWVRSNFQTYCYGGPNSAKNVEKNKIGPYTWEPYEYSFMGQHHWALDHIKGNHGWLGAAWPLRQMHNGSVHFLEGGGTIPWMGLIHNGLTDINQPHWGGWSGRFTRQKVKNVWSRHKDIQVDEEKYGDYYLYTEDTDKWEDTEAQIIYDNEYTPIWRWRRAMYNDFICRMDWCKEEFEDANHSPKAAVNGDKEEKIHTQEVKSGKTIELDASASSDPDGDNIQYSWWVYNEAGSYDKTVSLSNADSQKVSVQIPKDAYGKEIHVILEIKDDNKIASLYDYRRVVFKVK